MARKIMLRPLWERKILAVLMLRLRFERASFHLTDEQLGRLRAGMGLVESAECIKVFREVTESYYQSWVYPLVSALVNQNGVWMVKREPESKDPCNGRYLYQGMPISAWRVCEADLKDMAAWCCGTVEKKAVRLPDDGLPRFARVGEWLCKESTAGFYVLPDAVFQKLYVKSPV